MEEAEALEKETEEKHTKESDSGPSEIEKPKKAKKEIQSVPKKENKLELLKKEIQSQINTIIEENKFLKELILSKQQILTPEPQNNIIEKTFRDFNWEFFKGALLKDFDLEEFDRFVNVNRQNYHFFYSMVRVKKIEGILKEPTRYTVARFFNRLWKGDGAIYEAIFNLIKEYLINRIKKGENIE